LSIHSRFTIQSHDSQGRKSLAKRNVALFPVLDWIAEITTHIPDKREQLVRYYGAYSNASGGKRKKETVKEEPSEVTEVPPPLVSGDLKRRRFHFIRKAYETDPLVCAKWSSEMHTIRFIDPPPSQKIDKQRSTSGCRSCVWDAKTTHKRRYV
jgi:hypothetical protein